MIQQREIDMPEGAYTTYLFDKGIDKICKKVGEEATEVVIGAKNRDAEEVTMGISRFTVSLISVITRTKSECL